MWPRELVSRRGLKSGCLRRRESGARAASFSFEEAAGIPKSLQILQGRPRRKLSKPADGIVGGSIKKAFSSMVDMLKSVQRYTFEMRQLLMCDEVQLNEMWSFVQREMHASFLWIFQQVFSCTPKLMMSVMILLANFTVYSMDSSFDTGLLQPNAALVSSSTRGTATAAAAAAGAADHRREPSPEVASSSCGAGNNKNNNSSQIVAGGMDGDGVSGGVERRGSMFSQEETPSQSTSSAASSHVSSSSLILTGFPRQQGFTAEDVIFFKLLLHEATAAAQHSSSVFLEQELKQSLVAPVSAELEPDDDYECYDRTDLVYQHALSLDCANPLLLANYAQFLYLVRHDHDRAESLFRRAADADPLDGEVLSRFASFLWLGRGDTLAAEQVFKEAVAADPSNPFHVGDYAHFLWNAEEAAHARHAKQQVT